MRELPTEEIRQMRRAVDELTDSLMQMAWALRMVELRAIRIHDELADNSNHQCSRPHSE